MSEALIEQQPDVIVGQPVYRPLAFAPESDQVAVSQEPELMAHC